MTTMTLLLPRKGGLPFVSLLGRAVAEWLLGLFGDLGNASVFMPYKNAKKVLTMPLKV